MKIIKTAWPWFAGIFIVSTFLAWVDPEGSVFSGWGGYFGLSVFMGLLSWMAWRWLGGLERPKWLIGVLGIAFVLRIAVGAGLTVSLPTLGYEDSVPHQAGYIFKDAYNRDQEAWAQASSSRNLWSLWGNPAVSDQYGGLLFISAFSYRIFTPNAHRPLLIILLTASMGSLAALFAWSFTRRVFGPQPAVFAAWMTALYPEAVLLASSQMREPFLITGLALSLDGLIRIRQENAGAGVGGILVGLLISLLISPPFALLILLVIFLGWVWERSPIPKKIAWVLILLSGLGLIAFYLTVRAWSALGGGPTGGIWEVLKWWLASGANYQLSLLTQQSGWVQKIFGMVPEWVQMPLATVYGLVQPFLPAALMDSTSAPLIRGIVSWRALGWFFLLPFLLYAPFPAIGRKGWRDFATFLVIVVWVGAVLVSYRDAGRMWDNPRWRTVFLALQTALAGWAWTYARVQRSPWLMRTGVIIGIFTLAFIPWEAGRYYQIPRLNLWETLAVSGGISVIFLLGSMLYDRFDPRKQKSP